ncbi:MAG: hypothetical protein IPP74_15295, partial [Alphaproteobacteria bacterium]|nr:hypothetical protein [Alphaproteobacteria bacterium]
YVSSILIPLLSHPWSYPTLLPLQLSLFVGMMIIALFTRLPLVRFYAPRMTRGGFLFLMVIGSIILYSILVVSMGARFQFPTLGDLYVLRQDQRQAAASVGVAVYLISWAAKVVNPCLLVYGLVRHRWVLFLLGLLGQLFMFMQGGQKSMLIVIPLIIGINWVIQYSKWPLGLLMLAGLMTLVITLIGVDIYYETSIASSLLLRRPIITPGLLTGFYFDYFNSHPFVYYSHSFMHGIIDSTNSVSPPFLIGKQYFGNSDMSANANIWADAYANLGHLGIMLHSIIFGAVFWVVDCLAEQVEARIAVLLIIPAAWAMADSALFTSLLTHGLLLIMVVIWIFPPLSGSKKVEFYAHLPP